MKEYLLPVVRSSHVFVFFCLILFICLIFVLFFSNFFPFYSLSSFYFSLNFFFILVPFTSYLMLSSSYLFFLLYICAIFGSVLQSNPMFSRASKSHIFQILGFLFTSDYINYVHELPSHCQSLQEAHVQSPQPCTARNRLQVFSLFGSLQIICVGRCN